VHIASENLIQAAQTGKAQDIAKCLFNGSYIFTESSSRKGVGILQYALEDSENLSESEFEAKIKYIVKCMLEENREKTLRVLEQTLTWVRELQANGNRPLRLRESWGLSILHHLQQAILAEREIQAPVFTRPLLERPLPQWAIPLVDIGLYGATLGIVVGLFYLAAHAGNSR